MYTLGVAVTSFTLTAKYSTIARYVQKIEAPVRKTAPDAQLYGGKKVQERDWGQSDLNPELRDKTPEWKPPGSEISAADAWRYTFY